MRPLFLYVATTAGSLLVGTAILTGSTALTITTVRSAVILKKRIKKQTCQNCGGRKVTACESCQGMGTIAYAPRRGAPVDQKWMCPMCLGRKVHKCFNCLGYGVM